MQRPPVYLVRQPVVAPLGRRIGVGIQQQQQQQQKNIRCTAVSLNPPTARKAVMGTATESSVPIAELAGLLLAFQIAEEPPFQGQDLEIYTDNQGALQAVNNPRQASGQYLPCTKDYRRDCQLETQLAEVRVESVLDSHTRWSAWK